MNPKTQLSLAQFSYKVCCSSSFKKIIIKILSVHAYYNKWADSDITEKTLPVLSLETSLTEHHCYCLYQSDLGQGPLCGNALWAGLTATRYSLAVTEADALLRTSTATTSILGMWQPTESAWSPSEKKEHYEPLMQGNLFNCYKCLLHKKCLWPEITHTHKKKWEVVRNKGLFTNRLQTEQGPFIGNIPCGILSLKVCTYYHAKQIWCIFSLPSPHAGT